ncbi:unnamed protein product [Gongylonema pulchrum]|uniref:Cyclin N-terminal domain-containing protein n=1 Tax=Gongylonema pulchrum TaxID=637853 RepID=A0A183E1H4_9BILA|nr:unnamed protein product [Gongylonema pulchrum]
MKYKKRKFRVCDYLPKQPLMSKEIRTKVIDWYVLMQEDFELNHEVLYHAVKIFDLYLSATEKNKDFVCIAAASLILASKIDVSFCQISTFVLFYIVCPTRFPTKIRLLGMASMTQ